METNNDPSSCKVLCQRQAILNYGKVWPSWEIHWDLPPDVTSEQVLAQHSVPNLLNKLKEDLPLQVFEHRGMYNWGEDVQECTETSLLTALGEAGKRNLSELDAALTSDNVPAVFHEFNPWRVTTLPDRLVRDLHSSQIRNATVIIRDVELGKHSHTYTVTKDVVPFVEPLLDKVFKVNPNATIFLDGREFEAHIIAAWLSHRPRYHQRVILLFYSFRYGGGEAFVDAVQQEKPALNWRETVAVTPVLFPEELPKLASQIGLGDLNEDDLYLGGRSWIYSMLSQKMRIVAVQIMMARVTFSQMKGSENLAVIRAFNADHAAVRLAHYVKNDPDVRAMCPYLKLSTGTRAYVFSSNMADGKRAYFGIDFISSRERQWETDQRKWIRRGYATPGNAAEIADWVISDRSEDDMAIWQWRRHGVERKVDFRCPHLDAGEV
ncbi:hypothetical protein RRH01S_12_00960 [Rhizobium rhizogenes NBRC 13257]|uniref:GP-PDE domain-containing protein n=2 Tax=Rhizobium rhizogenes TaxID=359 RepID=A0AA87QC48_RHIRH|nr:hypothetical protein RRH01S_12_00960 [Rhizobium rhizogenes NBRC 13257]